MGELFRDSYTLRLTSPHGHPFAVVMHVSPAGTFPDADGCETLNASGIPEWVWQRIGDAVAMYRQPPEFRLRGRGPFGTVGGWEWAIAEQFATPSPAAPVDGKGG